MKGREGGEKRGLSSKEFPKLRGWKLQRCPMNLQGVVVKSRADFFPQKQRLNGEELQDSIKWPKAYKNWETLFKNNWTLIRTMGIWHLSQGAAAMPPILTSLPIRFLSPARRYLCNNRWTALTRHHHPKSIVYLRVHSWCWTFCIFLDLIQSRIDVFFEKSIVVF